MQPRVYLSPRDSVSATEPRAVSVATLDPPRPTNRYDVPDTMHFIAPAKVMTLGEVSRYFPVHRSTVYRLLKRQEIPAFRIGSDWRFNI